MQSQNVSRVALSLIGIVGLSLVVGCVSGERVVTYDVTKTGKDWVENETVQEHRDARGKLVQEKQFVYEKIKCVDKKGKRIEAESPEACIQAGGRVIDEMIIEEQTIKRKR